MFRYISGIIKQKGQKPIIVNGVTDHIHIFVGLRPSMAVSDLVRDIKNNSSKFINKQNWTQGKFAWQEGHGSFSYGQSQVEQVYQYILNQEKHHKNVTFKEEYIGVLKKFNIDYDNRYLFDWI